MLRGHEVTFYASEGRVFKAPLREFRKRLEFMFRGRISLDFSIRVAASSAYVPLLGAASSRHILVCDITRSPNLCDDERVNHDMLSSPLLPPVQLPQAWHFAAPAPSSPPECSSASTCSCVVAVVWTYWSAPPPYEMDWLSEVIDSSGCEVAHVLDLQMICKGRLFSGTLFESNFGNDRVPSKVFLVSYFHKDFNRGLGLMESCMHMWYSDGYDVVLVHFGDDGNYYEYLRYPRLQFVIRNHPQNVADGLDAFDNVLPLGIGYKVGFWPSNLRDVSSR